MAGNPRLKGHTGLTQKGHVRDAKVERIGNVTIYKRGRSYSLYYRENGQSVRQRIEGNLNSARAAASAANQSLEEERPSPFGYRRVGAEAMIDEYVDYVQNVEKLAVRTVDRYRAALSHFKTFAHGRSEALPVARVDLPMVEEFVKWMRQRTRARNGSEEGAKRIYTGRGIAFILSTCRTVFNWGRKRQYLPPYSENPFSGIDIDRIAGDEVPRVLMLSVKEQQAFFAACDDWQRPIFIMLAAYGLRVGELTHLLISDVDWAEEVFRIRSKPELLWRVKTRDERVLPILPEIHELLAACIGQRKAGFVFTNRRGLHDHFFNQFDSSEKFSRHLMELAQQARTKETSMEKEILRAIQPFVRQMGQIPEKRIRQEFMKLTKRIGRPDLTRVHSLRHLFSTRAQEQGMNPLLVQNILGHATLEMTRRYTHFGMEAKRQAVSQMLRADPVLSTVIRGGAEAKAGA
jgi:site-specific recombinase XerD